jgi:hypothetical protein
MDYTTLATDETINKVHANLIERGFLPEVFNSGSDALQTLIKTIPQGVSVMNGSSQTLEEIGYTNYLKSGNHGWNNLHEKTLAEKDPVKQMKHRRESVVSDFYVGSVHAITESGEMVIASGSGSQLSHLAFTSPNVILIISTQKITPTLSDALQRLEDHVIPLENDRMLKKLGKGTLKTKTLILHRESPLYRRKIHVFLVKEKLGF